MKLRLSSRKDLKQALNDIYSRYNIKYLGFVAKEGSSAGLPLIFYPENSTQQQELCGKIVGILREISDLKITFLNRFNEIIFNNAEKMIYLIEIESPIFFYCIIENASDLKRIRKTLFRYKQKLIEIFKKS